MGRELRGEGSSWAVAEVGGRWQGGWEGVGSEGLVTTAHSQAAGGTGGGAEELGAEGQSWWVVQGPEEAGRLRA